MPRHNLLIEVDEEVKLALEAQAKENMRSARKEAEFILRQSLIESSFYPKTESVVPSAPVQEEISI